MPICSIFGCSNHSDKAKGKDIHFFRFPKQNVIQKQWIHLCRRKDKINVGNARICSIHFNEDDFENLLKHRLMNVPLLLKKDAVPSKQLSGEEHADEAKLARNTRAVERRKRKRIEAIEGEERMMEVIQVEEKTVSLEDPDTNVSNAVTEETWEHEYRKIEEENARLKEENTRLKEEAMFYKNKSNQYMNILTTMFTPGQIQRLLNNKRTYWEKEDIAAAVTLRSLSSRCYKYLREVKGFPLPCESTLRNWIKDLNFDPGILENVLELMAMKSVELSLWERLVALTFDEIYLSNKIDIDKANEKVWGPHKTCLVIMARGIVGNWKQPIFYDFDVRLRGELFLNIVKKLYDVNYIVVSVTCDLGPNNSALCRDIGITFPYVDEKTYCVHPCDAAKKIFFFADVPHLLKLIRNNLIDHGLLLKTKAFNCLMNEESSNSEKELENDILIDKTLLQLAVAYKCDDLNLLFKLTAAHFDCVNTGRQKVSLAAQLLSRSVATAIKFLGDQDIIPSKVAKFGSRSISVINDWFDMLNSHVKFGKYETANAFGIHIDAQTNLLKEMSTLMLMIRVGKKDCLLPFQKGIVLTNKSTIGLFNHLKELYCIKYIFTARLNQDVLENFFSVIRGMGASNDHPCALQFKYRMKWYLLGRQSGKLLRTTGINTVDNSNDNELINIENFSKIENTVITSSFCSDLTDDSVAAEEKDPVEICLDVEFPHITVDYDSLSSEQAHLLNIYEKDILGDKMKKEGLKYLSGFIAQKFRKKYSELGVFTKQLKVKDNSEFDWLFELSRGYLMYPSDKLLKAADIMNEVFENFHGSALKKEEKIISKVCQLAEKCSHEKNCILPYEIVHKFVKTRTYIRLREMNRNLLDNCRKINKKLKKFVN